VAQAAAGEARAVPDLAVAQQTALGYLQAAAAGSRGTRRGAEADVAAGGAAAVLEGAVWGAMTSFQQWRTGLLMLNLVAKFTGVWAACCAHCHSLHDWQLLLLSLHGYIHTSQPCWQATECQITSRRWQPWTACFPAVV
jgi:hypothetical protein